MKKVWLIIFWSCSYLTLNAQYINFEWATTLESKGPDEAYSVTTDLAGNVYTTGFFTDTADFDPGPNTFNLIALAGATSSAFIQKLDVNGNFIWAKPIIGTNLTYGEAVAVDAIGNVYVAGRYTQTADFDPGPATFNLASNGWSDIFIQKLDVNGNFIWAKSFGGGFTDILHAIAIDQAGNIYATGLYNDTVDFNPGAGTSNLISKGGKGDIFIEKLDAHGNFVWAKSVGGSFFDEGRSITCDLLGNIYLAGSFNGTIDFDPGPSTFNLTPVGGGSILKLDTNGNFIWAKALAGKAFGITTDTDGDVYVTGHFINTNDFDPGPAVFNLTSNGNEDIFVQKFNQSGDFVWAKSMGGPLHDYGRSIAIDALKDVYITGFFRDTVDFDPNAGTFSLTSNGFWDIFIEKLTMNGDFSWAQSIGDTRTDNGYSIALDTFKNVYVAGRFMGTADFDPSASTFILHAYGGTDIFTHKLSQSTCAPGSVIDVSVTSSNNIITANAFGIGVRYQWLDCDDNYSILSGETNQHFTASRNGNYAVEIIENGCTDTSACVTISTVGTEEYRLQVNVEVFPNPASDVLQITTKGYSVQEVVILDLTGKIYRNYQNTDRLNVSALPEGIYFVKIKVDESVFTRKFVKR